MTREDLIKIFKKYGFIECADILSFLEFVCTKYPDRCAYIYIINKLTECLINHDNDSDYFNELNVLAKNINIWLAMKNQ
jgi:hypothetical protein